MTKAASHDIYRRILSLGQRFQGYAGLRINAALAGLQLEQLEKELNGEVSAVWSSPLVPAEILASFGLVSMTPETVSAVLSSAGRGGTLLDEGESAGISSDCCSCQRAVIAALEAEAVPLPEAFISTSPICDENPQLSSYLGRTYDRPFFLIDTPAAGGRPGLEYVVSQLKDLIVFLTSLTGRPLDPQRLSAAVEESNQARAHWIEANRIRRDEEPVMYGVAALRLAGGMLLQKLGHPALTAALADFALELRERAAAGEYVPSRKRLLWLHLFPLFDREFMRTIEVDLGLTVVFEESSYVWWEEIDPEDPLPGFARRILGNPLAGTVDRRLEALLQMAGEYRVDGVANFSHRGCKPLTGAVPSLARAFRRQGIPFLELSGDCHDNRGSGEALWRTRLEAFAEILC